MSTVLDWVPSQVSAGQLQQAHVIHAPDGENVTVRLAGTSRLMECQVLLTAPIGVELQEGDPVLVWVPGPESTSGVLLGRTGPYRAPAQPVVPATEFASRPQTLVLEAQGDLILRNAHAKISIGAQGDVDIVCTSYTTRSQRLLRLLAPLIKLN